MVDLPEPVGPVIRTRPWCRSARSRSTGGRPSVVGRGDRARDHPQRHRGQPALGERVAADPGVVAPGEGEVVLLAARPRPRPASGVSTSASRRVGVLGGQRRGRRAPGSARRRPAASAAGRRSAAGRCRRPATGAASSPSIRLPMRWTCVCMVRVLGVEWRGGTGGGPRLAAALPSGHDQQQAADASGRGDRGAVVDRGRRRGLEVLGRDQRGDGGRVAAGLRVLRLSGDLDGLAVGRLRRGLGVLSEGPDAEDDDAGQDAEDDDDDEELDEGEAASSSRA